jgi:Domain of unknown function (DUF4430)
VRRLVLVLAVVALSGCGGEDSGKATLWITRDKGAHVILEREVPAGLTAMQALDRMAEIRTRYSGRYVQSIEGIEGSIAARSDWFYFINGYEADRSAAEYRLRDGDVEWWDFRSWRARMREPVVVGAFPEPFLHGYGGNRLPARVVFALEAQRPVAERLARLIGGRATKGLDAGLKQKGNLLVLRSAETKPSLQAQGGDAPGDPVVFTFSGNPELLLREVPFGRFRYQVGR